MTDLGGGTANLSVSMTGTEPEANPAMSSSTPRPALAPPPPRSAPPPPPPPPRSALPPPPPSSALPSSSPSSSLPRTPPRSALPPSPPPTHKNDVRDVEVSCSEDIGDILNAPNDTLFIMDTAEVHSEDSVGNPELSKDADTETLEEIEKFLEESKADSVPRVTKTTMETKEVRISKKNTYRIPKSSKKPTSLKPHQQQLPPSSPSSALPRAPPRPTLAPSLPTTPPRSALASSLPPSNFSPSPSCPQAELSTVRILSPSAINLAALVAPEEPRNRVPSVMDPNGTCTLEIEVDVVDQVVERRPWVVSNLFILFSH